MKLSDKQHSYLTARNFQTEPATRWFGTEIALLGCRIILFLMVIDPNWITSLLGVGVTVIFILLVMAMSLVSIGYLRYTWSRYRRLMFEQHIRAAELGDLPEDPWSELACHRVSLEHLLFSPNWISSLRPLGVWGWLSTGGNAVWAVGLMMAGWHDLAVGILTAVVAHMMARRLHGRFCLSYLEEIDQRNHSPELQARSVA